MKEYRACEICGHTDVDTHVVSSMLGACSFNYCRVCMGMRAEMMKSDFTTTYNKSTDSYYSPSGGIAHITVNGVKFEHRADAVKFYYVGIENG